jgi:hypothetical protein
MKVLLAKVMYHTLSLILIIYLIGSPILLLAMRDRYWKSQLAFAIFTAAVIWGILWTLFKLG